MPYEDDYKMWLEKMLIESNPDWVCDGMYDEEITRNWCVDYCGKDDEYITPKCLHMYYHHIERADRKTESNSEKPNNCEPRFANDTNVGCKDEPQTVLEAVLERQTDEDRRKMEESIRKAIKDEQSGKE